MKKIFVVILAMCVCMSVTALAQGGDKAADKTAKAEKAPPLKTLVGTISADGKSFTKDSDKSSWEIKNPDDVKGHEGHHVKLSAHVYAKDKAIHVMKVDMVAEKAAGKKKSSM
jgi:hypothetical protein